MKHHNLCCYGFSFGWIIYFKYYLIHLKVIIKNTTCEMQHIDF